MSDQSDQVAFLSFSPHKIYVETIVYCWLLGCCLSWRTQFSADTAPRLSQEAAAFLKKAKQIRGNMKAEES